MQPDAGEVGLITLEIAPQHGGQRDTHIFAVHGLTQAWEFDIVHDYKFIEYQLPFE
jgi:hypothetical protein